MSSMRRFLLVSLFAIITLLAILEGVWSYHQGTHEIDEVFDAQLAQYARTLHGLIDRTAGAEDVEILKRRLRAADEHHNLAHHPYEAQVGFQVWRSPGDLIIQSGSLPADQLVPFEPGFQRGQVAGADWYFVVLYDAEHQRWIVAGQDSAVRRELAMRFASHDILSAVTLVLGLGLAVLFIMRVGLAPLDRLAREVAHRDAGDLGPVEGETLPRELQPLAASINDAFARLDGALQRERQFANDAAHELRTPVAIIQAQLENALADAGADERPALTSALQTTRNLGHLISQLLELARLEPGAVAAPTESFQLRGLLAEQVAQHVAAIDGKQLDVSLAEGEILVERVNRRLLEVLVRNLLDNAIKYTPTGGSIVLAAGSREGRASLYIADSGPGIPAAHREQVLQRFYRMPQQQSAAGQEGSGLGLTMVDLICQLHGAELVLEDSDNGGLRVSVLF